MHNTDYVGISFAKSRSDESSDCFLCQWKLCVMQVVVAQPFPGAFHIVGLAIQLVSSCSDWFRSLCDRKWTLGLTDEVEYFGVVQN